MIRRIVLPSLGAATVAVAVSAAAYGIVSTLPQPTHGDRTAVRLLRLLETTHGADSQMSVAGRTLAAHCVKISPRRNRVTLSDGSSFVLAGSHIHAWREPSRLLAATVTEPLLRAAEADLAGSYALYAQELTAELGKGNHVLGRATTFAGRATYEMRLSARRPRAALLVDRKTLRPVGAVFESSRLKGRAVFDRHAQAVRKEASC